MKKLGSRNTPKPFKQKSILHKPLFRFLQYAFLFLHMSLYETFPKFSESKSNYSRHGYRSWERLSPFAGST